MGRQITKLCKTCGTTFRYHKGSYLLLAEKGESRPERCPQCRNYHDKMIKELKAPYFPFQEATDYADFNLFPARYTDHGDRTLPEEEKREDLSGMDISITDEEILVLYEKLEKYQVVVIDSPTGTGKSTFVPLRLVEPPKGYSGDFVDHLIRQGQIVITQPRILPVKGIPTKVAEMSGVYLGPGQLVGYRYSDEDNSDRWNRIIFVTDGTLPNWIREGRLGQYSLIMVDEAHERSCNIDLILGFLKRELPKYPHLRVIISSATINTDSLLATFKEAAISADLLYIPSRKRFKKYEHWWKDEEPVERCGCWLCRKSSEERRDFWENQNEAIKEYNLPEVTANFALKILQETNEGSILIFLHGEKAVDTATQRIRTKCNRNIPVIPAYRKIQAEAEKKLEATKGQRRVIVATNIAETSLTIPDIVYVINSGWIKQPEYDSVTQVTKLYSKLHSQDGDKQRAGRAGRNQNGYVYHFITKQQYEEEIDKHTSPEITRTCLEDVLVNLKATGVNNVGQFPWPEEPDKNSEMKKEIIRAQQVLKTRRIVGENGEITEQALEFLGIPRSTSEASLLYLADEQGLLFEVMTILLLMSTRDGEARTGAALYNRYNGLLQWEDRWTAKTKASVAAIHQGLRVGCRDDLDFVIKLAYCFRATKEKGLAEQWASWYFINYEILKKALDEIDELITKFGEEREESIRMVNPGMLEKVRSLMVATWSDRIIELKPRNPVIYQLNEKIGVVSRHCVGNWKMEKKALWGTAVEEETVVNGYPVRCPMASFMVRLPSRQQKVDKTHLFIDQKFPVGSQVRTREERGVTYLLDLEQPPHPIKVNYKKTLDALEEPLTKKEQTIFFDKRFIDEFKNISGPVRGIWIGVRKSEQARITEWIEQDGVPVAALSPFVESDIFGLKKQKGDKIKAKIHKVARDPVGGGGWISTRTPSGSDIPVELNNMSFSPSGPGLEQIEGKTLDLAIEDISSEGNLQLSNLHKVTEDLRSLREQVTAGKEINLKGFVEEIREEEEKAIVIIPRAFGVVHSFEVYKDFVPGRQITNLRVAEEVVVRLSLPSTQADHVRADYFSEKEIRTVPSPLKYDDAKDELLFPYCLSENDLGEWPARSEVIDFVRRHSWQYCLQARIVSLKERLSNLKEMDLVDGIIQQVDYEEDGKTVKSLQVVVSGDIPGRAFGSDLGSLFISEGDRIPFYVKTIDANSGFLRLVSKRFKDEKKKKQEEFIKRTQAHIQRWQNNIRKARENIARVSYRLRTARTKAEEDKFKLWIEEDEGKIQAWLDKIESARKKLSK